MSLRCLFAFVKEKKCYGFFLFFGAAWANFRITELHRRLWDLFLCTFAMGFYFSVCGVTLFLLAVFAHRFSLGDIELRVLHRRRLGGTHFVKKNLTEAQNMLVFAIFSVAIRAFSIARVCLRECASLMLHISTLHRQKCLMNRERKFSFAKGNSIYRNFSSGRIACDFEFLFI